MEDSAAELTTADSPPSLPADALELPCEQNGPAPLPPGPSRLRRKSLSSPTCHTAVAAKPGVSSSVRAGAQLHDNGGRRAVDVELLRRRARCSDTAVTLATRRPPASGEQGSARSKAPAAQRKKMVVPWR